MDRQKEEILRVFLPKPSDVASYSSRSTASASIALVHMEHRHMLDADSPSAVGLGEEQPDPK